VIPNLFGLQADHNGYRRKTTTYETSDSETGAGGPGPTSLKNSLIKKKQNTVPTVLEP